MRIRVNFTVEVPPDQLAKLRALAEAGKDTAEAGWFVRAEAEEHLQNYLGDNGVNSRIVQRDGHTVTEPYYTRQDVKRAWEKRRAHEPRSSLRAWRRGPDPPL